MATTIYLIRPETYPIAGLTNTESLLFDGVDEFLQLGIIPELNNASAFTISLWCKDISVSAGRALFSFRNSATEQIEVSLTSTTVTWKVRNGDSSSCNASINNATRAGWHHYVFVYDGSAATANRLKIYFDGSDVGTVSSTPPTTSATMSSTAYLMRTSTIYVAGNANQMGVFDFAFTSSQVTDVYNSGCPNDLDTISGLTSPVHWWQMNQTDTYPNVTDHGTGTTLTALMGNMESGDFVTDTPC